MTVTFLCPGHIQLPFHPLANLFPMLSEPDLDDLGEDIRVNGQVETVKLHRGMILDGRNRYTAAGRKGLGVRTEIFEGTDREALAWVISKNLKRRHLAEGQRAAVAAAIGRLPIGANQHRAPSQAIAPGFALGVDMTMPSEPAMPQTERAELLNVSRRSVQHADVVFDKGAPELQEALRDGKVAASTAADIAEGLPVAQQAEVAKMDEKAILAAAKQIRKDKNNLRRNERSERIRQIAEASVDLPTGRKFPLIYLDPPTEFDAGDSDRSTENIYPTMTEERIAALPIKDLATDDCVLVMWSTVPWLQKSLRLIEGWGFDYKSCAFWDKVNIGLGFWWRDQVEVLIIATRGKPVAPENGSVLGPNLYSEKKGVHSAKPLYFRDRIDAVPQWENWPKVELFARTDIALPPNWFAWGNQARVPEQQSLAIEEAEEAAA